MPLPTLRTERLLLRPFDEDDAPRVQRLAGAREVASTTLNIPHPYPDGVAETWIGTHLPEWEAKKRVTLAIAVAPDGMIGGVSLHLALTHRRAELGYWIGVPHWNRGYATEASRALIDYGFEALRLHRVVARHLARNPASGRVMRKLGMSHEGTLREHTVKWGRPEDVEVYAILESEWRDGSGVARDGGEHAGG